MSENTSRVKGCYASLNPVEGVLSRSYHLLEKANNGNGPWCDIAALKNMTVQIGGTLGGGNVQLRVSNMENPSDAELGVALGAAIAAAGMTSLTGPYRYIRAVVAGATGGSIDADLHGCA